MICNQLTLVIRLIYSCARAFGLRPFTLNALVLSPFKCVLRSIKGTLDDFFS